MEFMPLAADTFGGWYNVARQTLAKLGRQLARVVGRDTVCHLWQRMGQVLFRDNMQMLLSRTPDHPPSHILGQLKIANLQKKSKESDKSILR